jgi:hypothetical protein
MLKNKSNAADGLKYEQGGYRGEGRETTPVSPTPSEEKRD